MPHSDAISFPIFDDLQGRDRAVLAASRAVVERFLADGDTRAPIRDLAAHAGISERTFYRYFPRKEDAVRPYLRAGLRHVVARFGAAPADQPLAEAVVEAHADLLDLAMGVDVERLAMALEGDERMRAVWLELVDEAEGAFAIVIGARLGISPASIQARMAATTFLAAGRIALDAARKGRERPSEVFARCLTWASPHLFSPPTADLDTVR